MAILTFFRIVHVLLRYGLDEFIHPYPVWKKVRLLLFLMPSYWFRNQHQALPRGERCRLALIELGTIFVKLGQALSGRLDLVPDDITQSLSHLQDDCPAFPSADAHKIIEQQQGRPVNQCFKTFNDEPLASASIAQVHEATLKTGESVIVKIVRPDIETRIEQSVYVMRKLATILEYLLPRSNQFRPMEVVEEFARTLNHETDMMREAANASVIRKNFLDDPTMYVAKVYWKLTAPKMMVMERIDGIPIKNIKAIEAAGIDRKTLAENGVLIFFKQVFRDNLFHADMHPGNVFVSLDGVYKAVDFGIVGSLSDDDKRYLAENFIAFFNQDYRRIAQLHIDSGWVNPNTRCEDLEAAVRSICEPIMGLPLSQISYGKFLLQLFRVAQGFDMTVQPQLILLQKTLFNIEGLGRQLYPDLDLWVTAKPFLEGWLRTHFSPRTLIKDLRIHWPAIRQELPTAIRNHLTQQKHVPAPPSTIQKSALLPVGLLIAGILSVTHDNGQLTPLLFGQLPLSSALLLLASGWQFWKIK